MIGHLHEKVLEQNALIDEKQHRYSSYRHNKAPRNREALLAEIKAHYDEALSIQAEQVALITQLQKTNDGYIEDMRDAINEVRELQGPAGFLSAPDTPTIKTEGEDVPRDYCYCNTSGDDGRRMVNCENKYCPYGGWFHLDCLKERGCDVSDVDDESMEWYCPDCRRMTGGVA